MEPALERKLLAECQGGSREAFAQLINAYGPMVRRLAKRLVADEHLADDVSQQVFLNAYQSLSRFRGEARFSTWLYRITVNLCGMHLRRRRLLLEGGEGGEDVLDRDCGPTENVDRGMLREALEKALPRLPWPQRQAISLFYLGGVSYPEIAEILGVPLGTVKAWISRGLERLRRSLRWEALR